MPVTQRNNITYYDVDGYRESFTEDSQSAVRPVQIAWNYMTQFPSSVMGIHTVGQGGRLSRLSPESHPWLSNYYCIACELQQGLGGLSYDAGSGRFKHSDLVNGADGFARYELTYAPQPYAVLSDAQASAVAAALGEQKRYVSRRRSPATEALTIGSNGFRWADTGRVISEPATKLFPTVALDFTWWWVPQEVIDRSLANYLGKVNSAAFDTTKTNADAETVLFLGVEDDGPYFDGAGNTCFHRTFKFMQRAGGATWNKLYRQRSPAAAPGFYTIIGVDGVTKAYETADLNNLFTATF